MATKSGEKLLFEQESYLIRGACFELFNKFGGDFKESVIEKALARQLRLLGLRAETQKRISIEHLGGTVGIYTPDLIVNEAILIELKVKPFLTRVDDRQFWTYLKASSYRLGFLVNFSTQRLEIKRRIYDKARPRKISASYPLLKISNPRLSASKGEGGFTLFELLIYVAIFGGIMLTVSTVLITIMSSRDTTNARYEVLQNIRFAAERIKQLVYDASYVTTSGSCPFNTLEATIGGATTTVSIVNGVLQTASSTGAASDVSSNTVDTSTVGTATQYAFQRKTWYDGTRYWVAFHSGTQIEFWYSTNGSSWTQNTSSTIAISTSDFSIEADSSNAFIAHKNGFDVVARAATSYPGTGFLWGGAIIAFDGAPENSYSWPSIDRDTNDKIRINSTDGTTFPSVLIVSKLSTNANDVTAWGSEEIVDSTIEGSSNKFGTVVPLAGGDMYAVWIDGTIIEGKKYTSGTGWDASPTAIATGVTGLENNMQMVSNTTADEAYLVYIDSNNNVVFKRYIDGTGWQTAVTLDSNTGNDYPTISINTANNDLYVFWVRSNVVYMKKGVSSYGSANWDSTATSLITTGTNTWLSSAYRDGNNYIPFIWTEGTVSPWNIRFFGKTTGAGGGGGGGVPLTSNLVTATTSVSCMFTKISNPAPAKPTLQFELTIKYNDQGNPQLIFEDSVRTTVSQRQ